MKSFFYILILLVVTGCTYSSSQINRELDETATMLQSDPAAAMQRLNKYDVAEFDDSATLAQWALLYSEALVANRISAPTDTIVNIAINYYENHNQRDKYQFASRLKALLKSGSTNDALAEALYLQKEKEFMLYKERAKRQQAVFIGLIILLIAITIIIWQAKRIKLKEARNESLLAEASSLMCGLSRNEALCSDLRDKLKHILSKRFDIIDQLCDTYFETQGTKTERKAIVDNVKSRIDELKSDTGMFAEMEKCVNDCQDSLLIKLRTDCPGIKPEEYRLFVYLACKLSSRSIAVLLGESVDVIYKRKSRLKAKISSLDTTNRDQFLSVF